MAETTGIETGNGTTYRHCQETLNPMTQSPKTNSKINKERLKGIDPAAGIIIGSSSLINISHGSGRAVCTQSFDRH
jgi:hypothetical protein